MPDLNQAAAMFASMSPQEPAKVTPFSALASPPMERQRKRLPFAVTVSVLDSINYMAFCDQHAGHYIHHVPHLPGEGAGEPPALRDTVKAIQASGFEIDPELWVMKDSADCSQCHAGCTDSPNSGKK